LTNKRTEELAEQIADAVVKRIQRERRRQAAAAKRRRAIVGVRKLSDLGTPKFKTLDGLYPAVAAALGLNRRYVYSVAKGVAKSPRVMKALREEIRRRLAERQKGGAQ
jgi:hypothetical protein